MSEVITRAQKGSPLTWQEVDTNFTALIGMKQIDTSYKSFSSTEIPPSLATIYFLKVNNDYLSLITPDQRQILTLDIHIAYKPNTSQIFRNIVGRCLLYKEAASVANGNLDRYMLNMDNLNPTYNQSILLYPIDSLDNIVSFDGITFEKGYTYFGLQIYDEDILNDFEVYCEVIQHSRTQYLNPFLEVLHT